MKKAKEIEKYLDELGRELAALNVGVEFHVMVAGGAFMLLNNKRKVTDDIDFAIIRQPARAARQNKVFKTSIMRQEIARRSSSVAGAAEFKQAVVTIARRHRLPPDWINDESASYYYEDAPAPEVYFWRSFSGIVFVYLPTLEYMLATKLMAYRLKDTSDVEQLLQDLRITTRKQAKAIVDKFISRAGQNFYEIDDHLDLLFP